MLTKRDKNILFDFLTRPELRAWRHLLFIAAFIPVALSQSFFVFGTHAEIPISTIYWFGLWFTVIIITIVYFNIYYLAPHFLSKGEYASYFIVLSLVVSGFVLIKYIAEYRIFLNADIIREFNGVTVLDGLSNLMLYSICIASSSITILFKQLMADNVKIESLENKQLQSSIDDIKNRIRPKFLYATLDYASEKVRYDPEQTSDTLFKLSELLRYQLYDCTRTKVLLASDIKFIRDYLNLELQNSENSFSFTLSVSGNNNKFVPPGLFSPWIEEIIRQYPTALMVKFDVEDCLIKFECTAQGIDLSACNFKKVEQKLKLLYANDIVINKGIDSMSLQLRIC